MEPTHSFALANYKLSPFFPSLQRVPFPRNFRDCIGMRAFETEEELNNYFQLHNKNHDFAVIFDVGNNNVTSTTGKQFKYTIRTRNNNFRTDQIFWNNVYDVANKGGLHSHSCEDIASIQFMVFVMNDVQFTRTTHIRIIFSYFHLH